MSTIVTRAGKGSALTHNEVDANFNNLNNDKIEAAQTVTLTNKTLSTGTAITAGTINNATIGASTPSSGAFTTLSATGVTTVQAGTAAAPAITTSGDTNTGIFFPAADTIAFTEGGVESMRIDSAGNVGIGTSSPTQRLDVRGSSPVISTRATNASGTATLQLIGLSATTSDGGVVNLVAGNEADNPSSYLAFQTRNSAGTIAEKMRLDSAGNLGLGVTPSAWSGVGAALQVGTSAAIIGNNANSSSFISNAYFDGTNYRYIGTGFATRFATTSGAYSWNQAASGTAGNTITFTTAMTLDASGNLGLGVTPSAWSSGKAIEIASLGTGTWGASGANYTTAGYYYNSGDKFAITGNYAMYSSAVSADGTFRWYSSTATGTAGNAATISERMRLDASGNLLLNTTTNANSAMMKIATATRTAKIFDLTATGGENWIIDSTNTTGSTDVLGIYALGASGLYLQDNGNVGIGTTSPATMLVVAGTVSITGGTLNGSLGSPQLYRPATDTLAIATGATERARIDASGFTQFSSNLVMPYQGAPTSKSTTATLTGAELITGILNTTGTSYTVTLPTGTNIEGALTWAGNNVSLDWTVINTASGTITIGANGNTTLGSLTIATGTSAGFRIRRTAANTFTVYRMR